ncbi:MAG: right-handed parallel beta-helix repeat-containing protein, partial [Candidatus Latescibacterota bacterium]
MSRLAGVLLVCGFILFSMADLVYAAGAPGIVFYVSPGGNDSFSGKSAQVTAPNGPFKSIKRAQQAVRDLKAQKKVIVPVTVYLLGGRYETTESLVFTPEDSGTEQATVIWAAYKAEKPVISGGKLITGWKQSENGRWTAEVPGVREGLWKFRQLYVNGESRQRARIPNEGFLRIAGTPDGGVEVNYATPAQRFVYRHGDIDPNWKNLNDIEIIVYHYWVDVHLPVKSVDPSNNMVTFARKSSRRLTDDFKPEGARYIVENVYEGLDSPGEWYLDRTTGILTYFPKPGEDMRTAEVIAPYTTQLVDFRGEPEKLRPVEHITFRGITFMHANFDLPTNDAGDLQAANTVPGAIIARGMRNCAFDGCTFKNLGTYALQFAEGCTDNRVTGSEIAFIGAGGIRVGGGTPDTSPLLHTGGTVISDNHIHHLGEVFPAAVGVWLGHTNANQVIHNEIDHLYYTGISIGWNWGYTRSVSRDNVMEYNHIHHVGQGMLSDMGGVYMLGIAPGTVVRNNLIHNIESWGYGGWGIYTD